MYTTRQLHTQSLLSSSYQYHTIHISSKLAFTIILIYNKQISNFHHQFHLISIFDIFVFFILLRIQSVQFSIFDILSFLFFLENLVRDLRLHKFYFGINISKLPFLNRDTSVMSRYKLSVGWSWGWILFLHAPISHQVLPYTTRECHISPGSPLFIHISQKCFHKSLRTNHKSRCYTDKAPSIF